MSFAKTFMVGTAALFLGIGALAIFKNKEKTEPLVKSEDLPVEKRVEKRMAPPPEKRIEKVVLAPTKEESGKEKVDRVRRLFSKGMDKLPIVETITYTSRVAWLKGRPAWIADYASHYETSRHFIARSLNSRLDYFTQNVSPGDKFNVFKEGKQLEFYLLVDLTACTLDFYYLDLDNNERVFLKSYPVAVGKLDSYSPSGSLTPIGKYKLGSKVGIYKPGIENFFQNQKTHMIEVFGTRWLPFEEEVENCSDSAKGYGIHGVPCLYDKEKDLLVEQDGGGTGYTSDGCIRLKKDDIEEIFAIVITKPTIVEIVKKKEDVKLPMAKEGLLE